MCFVKKVVLIFISCSFFSYLSAQNSEYRLEIGVMGGISSYIGDANKVLFGEVVSKPPLAYGGLLRYRFDTRFAVRGEYHWTEVRGKKDDISFNHPVHVADLCGEFNFFDLEKSKYKRFSKNYSPYIFVGVGAMIYPYEGQTTFGISIPFGVGLKVKLVDRLNLNVQYANRLLFKDNLEGVEQFDDPYKLNGSNILNNDLLSTFTIGLSFDLWRRKCDCMKF